MFISILLKNPCPGSAGSEKMGKVISSLTELLEHVMIYQECGVNGIKSDSLPRHFYKNPMGLLGIDRVCLPSYEPLKMCKLVHKNLKDPKDVCIIGYTDIDWLVKSIALKQHMDYTKAERRQRIDALSITDTGTIPLGCRSGCRNSQR